MLLRRLLLISLVLLCAYLAFGCAAPGQVISGGTTQLTVHFVADADDILKACPGLPKKTHWGCAKQAQGTCDIYLQAPSGFNDTARLETLGHEVFHCLGGKHP